MSGSIKKFQIGLQYKLSNREVDILKLICEELTTFEISNRLVISPKTVERHRSNIKEKIRCRNIVGLVFYALKHNIIEEEFDGH